MVTLQKITKQKVVIDANVLIKLFCEETDTATAQALFEYLVLEGIEICAPHLIITETMNVCLAKKVDSKTVLNFFEAQLNNTLRLVDLDLDVVRKACEIAESGHAKSGFPSFNDSIYHAVAITEDATLITADHRHYEKAKGHGHIVILGNWKSI